MGDAGRAADAALSRRRSRVWFSVGAAAMLLAALTIVDGGSRAGADDLGDSFLEVYDLGHPQAYVYGEPIEIAGAVHDVSGSCITFPRDCDVPTGVVYLTRDGGQTSFAQSSLYPYDDSDDFSIWKIDLNLVPPGSYPFEAVYTGDFIGSTADAPIEVVKDSCRVTLTQSSRGSQPGEAVTFTAELAGSLTRRVGLPVTFTDPGGTLGTVNTDSSGFASVTTSGLPQGTSTITASFGGDQFYNGCTSSVDHIVATDLPPIVDGESVVTDYQTPVTYSPMANDFDPEGGPIRIEFLDSPENGDLNDVAGSDTEFTYVPNDGFVGEDSISYIVYDQIGQSSAIVKTNFIVGCTPFASNDLYSTAKRTALVVPDPGVRTNDQGCDQPIEFHQPAHGTVTTDGNVGGFTYTPNDSFVGRDTFTYDYVGDLTSTGTVKIDVQVPDPPPTSSTTTSSTSTTSSTVPPTSSTTSSTTTSTTVPPTSSSTSTTLPVTLPPTTTTPPTTGVAYLRSVFADVFGRAPDDAGLAYWADRLAHSDEHSVVTALLNSPEGRRTLVARTYQQLLHRSPTSGELAIWMPRVGTQAGLDALRVALVGSTEAWTQAGRTPDGFLDLVYPRVLGRAPDAGGRAFFDAQLAGGAPRSTVGASILGSTEADRHTVIVTYQRLLGRAPSRVDLTSWVAALRSGTPEQALVATLLSSSEYTGDGA